MEEIDIAFTVDNSGLVAHRADCPMARKFAANGQPVLTMFGCTNPLPAEVRRHSCLEKADNAGNRRAR